MTNIVETIERQVEQLSAEQLRQFRSWYERFDSQKWDDQIEADIRSGKLDSLAEAAIADHETGKSTTL